MAWTTADGSTAAVCSAHVSSVAGFFRLLEGDFPEPGTMRAIAEYNVGRTLTLLRNAA
ncbi:hypothetical protein ACFSL4_14410 [Streptomyces caeni]|uniref:Uncharacterized protein n=1 Tax=Streptomyces caeni TaxID=2307231 RepID=A0ABW4IS49_9ACTN